MKNITKILSVLFLSIFNLFTMNAQQCGIHSNEDYKKVLIEARDADLAGDDEGSTNKMNEKKKMNEEDAAYILNLPFPEINGEYCLSPEKNQYVRCLLRTAVRVENAGSSEYSDALMNRYKNFIDNWTSALANSVNPFSDKLCTDYLNCLLRALAQRELSGIGKTEVDEKLNEKVTQILEEGCNPCSIKWMVIEQVNISWVTDNTPVTIKGRATWNILNILLNPNEFNETCNHPDYDDRITFPFACNESVVVFKGAEIPKPELELLDGDKTFASEIIDAQFILGSEDSTDSEELKIISNMNFDGHGEQVIIPIKDKLDLIKKRRPFSVSKMVTNDETPTYKAEFIFKFIPIW